MVNNFHFRRFQQITEIGNTDRSQCVHRSSLTNKTNRCTIFETGVKRTENAMDKRKRTNNDLQNITQKAKHRAIRTALKPGVNSSAPDGLKAHYYNPFL